MRFIKAFTLILFLTGCSSLSNIDKASEETIYKDWPVDPVAGMGTLIVVNPYLSQCCGATAPYRVRLSNEQTDYTNKSMMPLDHFFCVHVVPATYQVDLEVNVRPVQKRNINLTIKEGAVAFLAAQVDVRRRFDPDNIRLYTLDKERGMVYVNRALVRWQKDNASPRYIQRKMTCQVIGR